MRRLVSISAFLAAAVLASNVAVGAKLQPIPTLSKAEFKAAQHVYFDRCSGCHGALRKGATGQNITPAKTRLKTLAALEKILYEGTDGGMPGWGKDGFMTRAQVKLMAKFVQIKPPQPPE